MRLRLLPLLFCLAPISILAQETASPDATERDRSFLTGLIEDNLSGAGRSVRLDGFAGALSKRATFEQLTIADDKGVWLTIRDGAISWNRGALLRGRIEIAELTAAEINLPRRPAVEETPSQATGFSLPELPVSVSIGAMQANRVVLGAPIMGVAADVKLDGSMQLANGEGSADIAVTRIDGKLGTLSLKGSYANSTRQATLDLLVKEAADGIAVGLLNIPSRPSAELAVHGNGVIDQFRADISLRTDGQPRVAGHVQLGSKTDAAGAVTRSFATALAGDITPLFLPEYQEFFGEDVSLEAEGQSLPSGQLDLSRLVIDSRGVDLKGQLSLNPERLPLQADMTLAIGLADGSNVLLPIPGDKTLVAGADLKLRYDSRTGNDWTLGGTMRGLKRPSISIAALDLNGSGRVNLDMAGAQAGAIGGSLRFAASGVDPAEAALQEALGPAISGSTTFSWQPGGRLRLTGLEVAGDGYKANGTLTVDGIDSGIELTSDLQAEVTDLQRFSGLAGRELGGSGRVTVKGSYGLLSGIADADVTAAGRDLKVSMAELDNLMKGEARIAASVRRDEAGTRIRSASLDASSLSATAEGLITSTDSDLKAELAFTDLAALGGRYGGALTASATMKGPSDARAIGLTATGDGLAIGQPEIDRIIGGRSDLKLSVVQKGDVIDLKDFVLKNGQVSVEAKGTPSVEGEVIALTSRLRDMALLAPGFPGPLTLDGKIVRGGSGYGLDLKASGPGGTRATITGSAATDFATTDLRIEGGAQSAIINPFIEPRNIEGPISFDLRLNGQPQLQSLTGNVRLSGARIVAPEFAIELADVAVSADLAGQRATISGSGRVEGGGQVRISGPVGLTPTFDGDLSIELASVGLRDPELFDTDVSGTLRVAGPLTGGAMVSGDLTLGVTEFRIPSAGGGGEMLVDNLTHVAEPAAVRETRRRAGLVDEGGSARPAMRPFVLDVSIAAPRRIFVRGRGLDVELGGALRIGGTSDNVVPSGQFDLVRGRLDILGKRFNIDEGLIQLQGALTPYIRFGATTESEGIRATILIEGDATAPEILFQSTPELPQEEVIARILFSKSLTSLSPFQAAQLAGAVATLAGRGGDGIVSKLRKAFGLDDLDLTTGADGRTGLRVGKYLSEKVYTDVDIGSDGKTELHLNLELRRDLTVRGTVGAEGTGGVGVFFERDY
ncbi:MAG: translocation/assembly module TamB domain-containing protein [Proteobacteria bacterium]|nr:translocation/assembly module TamB domain-containing protein [Pseudomonadota bacterium]